MTSYKVRLCGGPLDGEHRKVMLGRYSPADLVFDVWVPVVDWDGWVRSLEVNKRRVRYGLGAPGRLVFEGYLR